MPLYGCEGIVLRSERLEESDRLVHFFTDRFGRVRARAYGVARTTNRQGSIAEPFSHDQLSLYKSREDRAIFSLSGATLLHAHEPLRTDLAKYYAATFIAEGVDRCTQDGDPHYDLWLLLLKTYRLLEQTDNPGGLLLAFQIQAFRSFGVALELDRCVRCGAALNREPLAFCSTLGGVIDQPCLGQEPTARGISLELYRALKAADTRPIENAAMWNCPIHIWTESVAMLKPILDPTPGIRP